MRQTTSRLTHALAAITVLMVCAVVAACQGGGPAAPPTPEQPVRVAGSVVSTATSSNEAHVIVPEPVATMWQNQGAKGSGLEWVKVGGDGKAARSEVDLAGQTDQALQGLTNGMTSDAAAADGRSALAGLDAITSPAKSPVWVFSPLLDTTGPLDANQLAFDTAPANAVKATKKAAKLPKLTGRDVTFVVTPVAGQQKKLSKLQVGYQRAVWEGVARAAGAKRVTFFDGTGTSPGTGMISPVPIPDPNADLTSERKGKTRTCTLPAPALFVADQPTLIDKSATLKSLDRCVGKIDSSTKITVEGHTAGEVDQDNAFATKLSVQRATEVAALLKELDVPARNIEKVVGYGPKKPLVEPASSPRNRAVVVTFTATG